MAVFFVVIASGVYGLAMQQVLPRFLKVRVPLETFPQQIPSLLKKFRDEAEELLKSLSVPAKASPVKAASAVGAAAARRSRRHPHNPETGTAEKCRKRKAAGGQPRRTKRARTRTTPPSATAVATAAAAQAADQAGGRNGRSLAVGNPESLEAGRRRLACREPCRQTRCGQAVLRRA